MVNAWRRTVHWQHRQLRWKHAEELDESGDCFYQCWCIFNVSLSQAGRQREDSAWDTISATRAVFPGKIPVTLKTNCRSRSRFPCWCFWRFTAPSYCSVHLYSYSLHFHAPLLCMGLTQLLWCHKYEPKKEGEGRERRVGTASGCNHFCLWGDEQSDGLWDYYTAHFVLALSFTALYIHGYVRYTALFIHRERGCAQVQQLQYSFIHADCILKCVSCALSTVGSFRL